MESDEEKDEEKVVGQYRLALNSLLYPLRRYGQAPYVDGVIEELVSLAIQLHLKLSGVDMPYSYNDLHW